MNVKSYFIIAGLVLLCGCGTLRRPVESRPAEQVPEKSRTPRILYPEGSIGENRVDEHIPTAEEYFSSERFEMTFTDKESAHVRAAGIHRFPDEGFTVSLDELAREFCYPYRGKFISDYGMRGQSFHTGVDIKCVPNDTIRAALPGVVRMSKLYSSYGNIVVIRHYCGLETVYSHNTKNLVAVNQVVESGQPIALAGRTGRATTEHLHFEIRAAGEHFDPKLVIDCNNMEIRPGMLYVRKVDGTVVAARSMDEINSKARSTAENRTATEASRAAAEQQSARASQNRDNSGGSQNPVYYKVKKGDTLYGIALRNKTTVKKLCELNGIKETAVLQINQRLRIK